jgi:ribonuclease T2
MQMNRTTLLVFLSAVLSAMPARHASAADYVLAVTWQPAFCEISSRKPECRAQRDGNPDTRRFSLHGLWPQPISRAYCGVSASDIENSKSGRWRDIDIAFLPGPLWRRLQEGMPGTRSRLHRHEWVKHGSCMPDAREETYFEVSLDLLDEVNASPLAALMAERIGKPVTGDELRAAFEAGFGPGTGSRLRISCVDDDGRRLIREITIGLSGDPFNQRMSELVAAAVPTDPGCPGGIVDPAGRQ